MFNHLEKCPDAVLYYFGNGTCEGTYNEAVSSHNNYGRGWKTRSNGSTYGTDKVEKVRENPWTYKSQKEMKSHPFIAQFHVYPGGGYARSLGRTLQEAQDTLQYLKRNRWIDSLTRAVFLEFVSYNNNDNFYCIVTLTIEKIGVGGAFPFWQIITTRLDRYNSKFSFFLAACEISFLLLSFHYMWLEVKKARKKGFSYLLRLGSLVEILIFSLTWITFGLLLLRLKVVKWTKNAYKKHPNNFTSFQYAISVDMAYGYTIATAVALVFLKILKVLRSNKDIMILLRTLQLAGDELRHYFIFFVLTFIAFVFWGTLTFGRGHEGYPTFVRSCMSIFNLLLGASQYDELVKVNRVIAPIFFAAFVCAINVLLINLFLTIVIDAFSHIRVEMAHRSNKYDIFAFVFARFMTFCPWLSTKSAKRRHRKGKNRKSGLKQRQFFDKVSKSHLFSAKAKMDKADNILDSLLLSEYEEIEELSRLTLKNKRTGKRRHVSKKIAAKSPQYLDVKGY